jgi:hypothetical protein
MKKFLSMLMVLAILLIAMPFTLTATADMFETDGYLSYAVIEDKVIIADCDTAIAGKLEIPETLGGYPVNEIGDSAFRDCKDLTEIVIPESVTGIAYGAFYECIGLTKITIPLSVSNIGDDAFYNCYYLSDVYYTGTKEEWYEKNLYDFDPMVTMHFGDDLIDGYLTYELADGKTVITDCDSAVSGEFEIPEILGGYPVTEIATGAFGNCTKLTKITIPDTVDVIGEDAFAGCTGLTKANIPDNVTVIMTYAFFNCSALTEIKIPPAVKEIMEYAFCSCSALHELSIPASVESIDSRAFYGCSGLETITVDEKNETYYSSGNCLIERESGRLIRGCTTSVIPDSVRELAEYAFADCFYLTDLRIPASVESIDNSSFFSCSGLETITVDEKNDAYYSSDNCLIERESDRLIRGCKNSVIPDCVKIIGNSAFSNCAELTEITIPEGVTEIWQFAFAGCEGLTEIKIPDTVKELERYVFFGCTGLTKIILSNSVTKIGESTFDGCTSLTEITIPNSVTEISEYAFFECTSLESIVIPASVTSIHESAFEESPALTDVYYTGTQEDWESKQLFAFDVEKVKLHFDYIPVEKPDLNNLPVKVTEDKTHIIIAKGLTVEQTKETFKEFIVNILDINGNKLEDDGAIGTGTVIEIYNGEKLVEKKVVVFKGDINGDGQVKTTDARNALRGALGLDNLSDAQILAADVNNDGTLKATDARSILRGAMGLDETDAWLG